MYSISIPDWVDVWMDKHYVGKVFGLPIESDEEMKKFFQGFYYKPPAEKHSDEACCQEREYSDKWDSWFCPIHNLWLEPKCLCDPNEKDPLERCPFEGWNRPDNPLDNI